MEFCCESVRAYAQYWWRLPSRHQRRTAVEKSLRELRDAEAVSQFTATNKAVVTLVWNQHSVASVPGSGGCPD
jgi:hypothetical protein